jgi:hypothetical protein
MLQPGSLSFDQVSEALPKPQAYVLLMLPAQSLPLHLLLPLLLCSLSSSHIELPCSELPQPYSGHVAKAIAAAARTWWQTVVASPSSFTKPTYYMGMGNWSMTNMLADGAHERTPGAIRLLVNGAKGFYKQGDKMCFGVKVSFAINSVNLQNDLG